MIIAGTGHRPAKLGGHSVAVDDLLFDLAVHFLESVQPHTVISGMALGWDTALADAALALGIPLWAAVPFHGQESTWRQWQQARHHDMLRRAARVHYVSKGGYSPRAMQRRNEWMVDECDALVSLWDGSSGGTANCIAYANTVRRDGWNLWLSYVDAAVNKGLLLPKFNQAPP